MCGRGIAAPCFWQWRHLQLVAVKSCQGKLRKVDGQPTVVLGQQAHAVAGSEHAAPDERKNHGRRKRPLRRGGCSFYGGFRSVDNDCLFAALGSSGVDRVQVDAFGREFIQTLREGTGLVGQIAGFCGSFLVCDAGRVKRFLRAPGIIHDELNAAGRALGGSQERKNIHLGVPKGSRDCGNRTRMIINGDRKLLGFGHVGTSCRFAEIIRPDGLRGGSDAANQVFLLGLGFGADGEGVEEIETESEIEGFVLATAQLALAEDFHADNTFACGAHFADDADDSVGSGVHESANGIDADEIDIDPGRLGGSAEGFDAVARAAVSANDALFFGFGEDIHNAFVALGPVAFGEAVHEEAGSRAHVLVSTMTLSRGTCLSASATCG